jgi:hypothetical protein
MAAQARKISLSDEMKIEIKRMKAEMVLENEKRDRAVECEQLQRVLDNEKRDRREALEKQELLTILEGDRQTEHVNQTKELVPSMMSTKAEKRVGGNRAILATKKSGRYPISPDTFCKKYQCAKRDGGAHALTGITSSPFHPLSPLMSCTTDEYSAYQSCVKHPPPSSSSQIIVPTYGLCAADYD